MSCQLRSKCQLPASLQQLEMTGGSLVPLLQLPELHSLTLNLCETPNHHELAAVAAALTKLTHVAISDRHCGYITWLCNEMQWTVAALAALPLRSLCVGYAATPLKGFPGSFACPELLGCLTALTMLELSDQQRPDVRWTEDDAAKAGGPFNARSLAASLQELRCLQEFRIEGYLDDEAGADAEEHRMAAEQLMRVLAFLPKLGKLHLALDDVGPAVLHMKDAQQLTSLYFKSRSATHEQVQQLAVAGRAVEFCAYKRQGDSSDDDD
jgi:hypothetical protein